MTAVAVLMQLVQVRLGDAMPVGEAIVCSIITIFLVCGLNQRFGLYSLAVLLDPATVLSRFIVAIMAGGSASVGVGALLQTGPADVARILVHPLAWCLASGAAILGIRSALAWRLQRHARDGRFTSKFAVIGATAFAEAVLDRVSHDPGTRSLGVYADRVDRTVECPAGVVRGAVGDLVAYARHKPLDAVIIALPSDAMDRIAAVRQQLSGLRADIYLAEQGAGPQHPAKRLVEFGGIPVLPLVPRPLADWRGVQKAAFDRVLSAVLLLLGFPLMSIIAASIKLSSPGPVLFRQAREGLDGVPFTMVKFRTMTHDEAADQSVQATRRDARVTPVGYWLRRTSLDELPQLFNVLRGDMSLVGPRPHYAATCAGTRLFRDVVPGYAARHRMKPGLTGWAQVQGLRGETRTEQQITDRVAHDLYYIENWSFGFDLKILFRTLKQEVLGRSDNAY